MGLNSFLKDKKDLISEFFRYVLIGGSAFLIDFLVMVLFNEFIFNGENLYWSVFIGYTFGLIYNFILSLRIHL